MHHLLQRGLAPYFLLLLLLAPTLAEAQTLVTLRGRVLSTEGQPIPYAGLQLGGSRRGAVADSLGGYQLQLPEGRYRLRVSALGYQSQQRELVLTTCTPELQLDFRLVASSRQLEGVEIVARGIGRLQRSPYNAVTLESRTYRSSTKSLSDVLAAAPGVKVRQMGGVGSDTNVSLDGFSGKHVKVFIDGIPQEGLGRSFGLNNIPISYAERIEVYRGVVPVDFATDAIGGVINIVTSQRTRPWYVDASYAAGSFATHRSTLSVGGRLGKAGFFGVEAFQNYSRNNYWVDTPVQDFASGTIDLDRVEHVQRFHDTYHNEAVVAKLGLQRQPWADRLQLSLRYAQYYKEIQTGVRQSIVFGERHRRGYSWSPTLEYVRRQLLDGRLDLTLMTSYTQARSTLIDTTAYKYNWRGERELGLGLGEQGYAHNRDDERTWTASLSSQLRLKSGAALKLSHQFSHFTRETSSLLARQAVGTDIPDRTAKGVTGLSLQLRPEAWLGTTLFVKHYLQRVSGAIATTGLQGQFVRHSYATSTFGYGLASSAELGHGWQLKASYERAYRLPSITELFGDNDLDQGKLGLRPEYSHNLNLNASWSRRLGVLHQLLLEGGLIWRDTRDYIQRTVQNNGGGHWGASYINYGRVQTRGLNLGLHYDYSDWLSLGGNYTLMDVRDALATDPASGLPNVGYKHRMPNLPYSFGGLELSLRRKGILGEGSLLSLGYDNQYTRAFTFYSERLGVNARDFLVPDQLAHNLTMTLSLARERYALSLECRNLTDAALYDNYSLQKAGRAIYAKLRVHLGH